MAGLMNSISLIALLTCIVTAQSLQSCGAAQYNATQLQKRNFELPLSGDQRAGHCWVWWYSVLSIGRDVHANSCNNGKLNQIPPGCIGNGGDSPICDDNACEFLAAIRAVLV
ncbi:hypothetical protein K438DRAFT_1791586 [Mycena galopus ATCC 62051]|nr:hypothetical protein K438DRAFT_1791586 [Mycena galopus ATCC 62051]